MSELKVDKITPRLGTTLTLGDSGDTINFGSGVLPNFENLTVTGDLTVDTNSLYVDSANNRVGIGTTSPTESLYVQGSGTTRGEFKSTGSGSASSVGAINDAGSLGRVLMFGSAQGAYGSLGSGEMALYSNTAGMSIMNDNASGVIKFSMQSGAEKMRIDSSGNVGIGTSSPTAQLTVIEDVSRSALTGTGVGQIHISGGATPADNDVSSITFSTNNTTTASSIIGNQLTNNGSNLFFGTSGNYGAGVNNTAMFINYAGNVGIGVAPTFTAGGSRKLLQVTNGSNGGQLSLSNDSNESNNPRVFGNSADLGFATGASGSGVMQFYTNTTERMRIDSSGNVLVGKTSDAFADVGVVLSDSQANAFTRDGANVISVRRNTSDGDIVSFYKDTTKVGSIHTRSGNLSIGSVDTGLEFNQANDIIFPANPSTNNTRDNAIDLGSGEVRFKNLYLSSSVYLGGTGSANALDDYEEGTWTPTISGTSSAPTYYNRAGTYTKVGNLVTATLFLQTNAISFSNNNDPIKITGYPFTPTGNTGYGFFIGSLSSQSFYYNGTYNDYGTNGVCHPEFQTVDSTIRFIVTASGGIRGSVKNLGMTVSGFVLQCWFQHYAT